MKGRIKNQSTVLEAVRNANMPTLLKFLIVISFLGLGFFGLQDETLAFQVQTTGRHITHQVDPQIPGSKQQVTIRLNSYLYELTRANIEWKIGSSVILSGIGKRQFSFTTGRIGEATRVEARIKTLAGEEVTKIFTFRPADVDLIWETETYAPVFYPGKPLITYQSLVRIVAIPHLILPNGSFARTENLMYEWKHNGEVLRGPSGMGESELSVIGYRPGSRNRVGVTVSTLNKSVQAHQFIDLPAVDPQIVFYEERPLWGILHARALGTIHHMGTTDLTIVAEPYYISLFNPPTDLNIFSWFINEQRVIAGTSGNKIALRQNERVQGQLNLEFEISALSSALHNTRKSLKLELSPAFLPNNI
jgi:hypothetical protein